MKRTIKEIYEIIKQKRESAINDYCKNGILLNDFVLKGEIEAYTDVLVLLETSEVVEDEIVR